jgi:uncharacterized protein YjbI with pentapeptide repeats
MSDLVELLQRGAIAAFNQARSARNRVDLFAADLAEVNLTGADLSSANLGKADLTGSVLRDVTLARADLSETDGAGIDLTGAMAVQIRAKGSLWEGAVLDGADLSGADLTEIDLRGARGAGTRMDRARLRGADLTDSVWIEASFAEARLHQARAARADLTRADLTQAAFTEAGLEKARMDGVIAVEANFSEAKMAGASLVGARLQGAVCTRADMRETALAGADLVRANLAGADLSGADLRNASLADANLDGVKLEGAKLDGADFTGTDPRVLGLDAATIARLSAWGAPEVDDAPVAVEDPVAARWGLYVALLWSNADTETLSTLRWALLGPAGTRTGTLPTSAEGLKARLVVAQEAGFLLMLVVDRPGGAAVVRFLLTKEGEVGAPEVSALHYPPAVLPVAWSSEGALRLCGFAQRGPTLVLQQWGPNGLEVLRSDRIGNGSGFWNAHHPVVATRGGVVVPVGPKGPDKPLREPAGFPGKIGKVAPTPLGPLAVWFQPAEDPKKPGSLRWAILGGRGEPEVQDLAEGRRVSHLDAVAAADGVHVAWLEHRTLTDASVKRAVLPGSLVEELPLHHVAELRFAPGDAPALVLSMADGSVRAWADGAEIGSYTPADTPAK